MIRLTSNRDEISTRVDGSEKARVRRPLLPVIRFVLIYLIEKKKKTLQVFFDLFTVNITVISIKRK
jgi:hypothetical protein